MMNGGLSDVPKKPDGGWFGPRGPISAGERIQSRVVRFIDIAPSFFLLSKVPPPSVHER